MENLGDWLLLRATFLVPLLLSLTVHEWAHAVSARRLGDDTAERLGRVTLNPIAHIDPVGTMLLPLLGVPFGWARPVPVNPLRFHPGISMGRGLLITAAAGPLSNLVLAAASSALLAAAWGFTPASPGGAAPLVFLLETLVRINVVLALFNLLPVPPLDGSRIAEAFVPRAWRPAWDSFAGLAPLFLGAIILLPFLGGFSIFEVPLAWVERWLGALRAL